MLGRPPVWKSKELEALTLAVEKHFLVKKRAWTTLSEFIQ
jgi:hypothetical protein